MQNTGITNADPLQRPLWAELIKQKRLALKESQTVFGWRWGVTHAAVSYWESGQADPPAAVIWWLTQGEGKSVRAKNA